MSAHSVEGTAGAGRAGRLPVPASASAAAPGVAAAWREAFIGARIGQRDCPGRPNFHPTLTPPCACPHGGRGAPYEASTGPATPVPRPRPALPPISLPSAGWCSPRRLRGDGTTWRQAGTRRVGTVWRQRGGLPERRHGATQTGEGNTSPRAAQTSTGLATPGTATPPAMGCERRGAGARTGLGHVLNAGVCRVCIPDARVSSGWVFLKGHLTLTGRGGARSGGIGGRGRGAKDEGATDRGRGARDQGVDGRDGQRAGGR